MIQKVVAAALRVPDGLQVRGEPRLPAAANADEPAGGWSVRRQEGVCDMSVMRVTVMMMITGHLLLE